MSDVGLLILLFLFGAFAVLSALGVELHVDHASGHYVLERVDG